MKRYFSILVLFLFAVPGSGAQQTKYVSAIRILSDGVSAPKKIQLTKSKVVVALELGDYIEEQIIALHPFPGVKGEFKVEQQFQTSLTIQNEGPHLDLVNWKHYYSEWRQTKKLGQNRFLTLPVTEAEASLFPKVTPQEIYAVVLKAGGKSWANLVRKVKHANDYPAAVSVSKISLRISVKEGGQWTVLHIIDFLVPMGC